jgi:hypothetical protein
MLTATILALGLLSAGAAPASAERLVINDPDMPASGADLSRLVVNHTETHLVIRGHIEFVTYGSWFSFWIDTPRHTRNYHGQIYPESGYAPVLRVRGFTTKGKAACHRWTARFATGDDVTVTAKIPRPCFGNVKRVRVSARATIVGASAVWRDWAPKARRWTAWVHAG